MTKGIATLFVGQMTPITENEIDEDYLDVKEDTNVATGSTHNKPLRIHLPDAVIRVMQ